MGSLVLCTCVLILASSSAAVGKQLLKNAVGTNLENDVKTCLTEQNATEADIYREEDIMTNLHTEPENEERTRKNGCIIACFMKKQNLMEGSTIKEANVHELISKMLEGSYGEAIAHGIARKCMRKVRPMTQECKKSFSLHVCGIQFIHKLQGHEEHEREEWEEETEIEENVETKE